MFPEFSDIFSWKLILLIVVVCVIRQFLKGAQFHGKEKAKGKVIIVTGCSVGIGKQIVRELNYRGGKIYMGCRDLARGEEAISSLVQMGCSIDRMILLELDLASFASIKKFAKEIAAREQNVDILINNAGVMMRPKFHLTEDGHEYHWQVNYLGHFLLTQLLLPLLKATTTGARVINVTCPAHNAGELNAEVHLEKDAIDQKSAYDSRAAFSRSKLAQVLSVKGLTKFLRREGIDHVTVNACSPGLAYTRHFRYLPLQTNVVLRYTLAPISWFLLKTPKDGAQTPLFCALDKSLDGVSGKYYGECKEKTPSDDALNADLSAALFDYSLRICGSHHT